MKKLLLSICILLTGLSGIYAQKTDQEIDLIESILNSEIKVFYAQNIKLKTTETEAFWAIYDEYETALKPITQQRVQLLKKIIAKDGELTESESDKKILEFYKSQKERLKLRMKYYKKIKKKIGLRVATQFYQIDGYIYTNINATINESMPIIIPKKN